MWKYRSLASSQWRSVINHKRQLHRSQAAASAPALSLIMMHYSINKSLGHSFWACDIITINKQKQLLLAFRLLQDYTLCHTVRSVLSLKCKARGEASPQRCSSLFIPAAQPRRSSCNTTHSCCSHVFIFCSQQLCWGQRGGRELFWVKVILALWWKVDVMRFTSTLGLFGTNRGVNGWLE